MSIEKELKELKELLETGDFEQDKDGIKEALRSHKENIIKERQAQKSQSQTQTFNKIIIGMIALIFVAVGFTIYLYTQVDNQINQSQYPLDEQKIVQKEQTPAKNETKKVDLKAQEAMAKKLDQLASKTLTFENLPKEIQEQYVLKSSITDDKTIQSFDTLPKEIQDQYVSKSVLEKQLKVLEKQFQDQVTKIEEEAKQAILAVKEKSVQTKSVKPAVFADLPKEQQIQYISKKEFDAKVLQMKNQTKTATVNTNDKKAITFLDLPPKMQAQYISRAEHDTKIYRLNEELKKAQKKISTPVVTKQVVQKVAATPPAAVVATSDTPYNYTNEAQKALSNAAKPVQTVKCYDTGASAIELTATCQKNITDALDKNKGAKYFEIVGVIGQSDKDKFNTTDEKALEYLSVGLAQSRANESAWFIRKKVGDTPTIRPVNYPVYSKQDNKGVIIKIYQ